MRTYYVDTAYGLLLAYCYNIYINYMPGIIMSILKNEAYLNGKIRLNFRRSGGSTVSAVDESQVRENCIIWNTVFLQMRKKLILEHLIR